MAAQMDFGLLWYDDDRKCDLGSKVERAAQRYQAKFGRRPNVCYVHQASIERETEWQGVRVMGSANILPNHYWIGVSLSGSTKR